MADPILPPVIAAEEPYDQPLQYDIKTIFLGGIFFLLFIFFLHNASDIVIPIMLAIMMKLVLQPLLRFLNRFNMPRSLSALVIITILASSLIAMGTVLSGPAVSWGKKLPESFPHLQERLHFLIKPVENTQKILMQADNFAKGSPQKSILVAMPGTSLSERILDCTQAVMSELFTTTLVLFFLLVSGDTFLRRFVEILPRFKDKRQAVDISLKIEEDISIYLLTITIMNMSVGILAGTTMWLCGVDDPVLWGTLAFLLNYVPILGPLIGIGIFIFVGLLAIPDLTMAIVPAAIYLVIHLLEGTLFTPMLLAKRFTLNPVLVIIALIFWYWLWGFQGAILAMPMLAITKIICDRINSLSAFGHFLSG